MCGICGTAGNFSKAEGAAIVARMNATMVHRGPDDSGEWAADGVAFGMRRLSIIDIEGGHQPMWADGGPGVVYNGEIYNYRELREQLQSSGVALRTRSDTEVIPHLYSRNGPDFVRDLIGMFGICLYDPRENKLLLYRDRLGVKPLYYARLDGRFYFASEIKAILAGAPERPTLNRRAIHHYLTLRYVPAPETMWDGIFKLEPGCRLEYDLASGEIKISRYWSLDFRSERAESGRDYPAEFEKLFLDSVHRRLVASDVPVGVLLSGGLDSSAVSAAAVEMGHKNFHTFNVSFSEGGDFSEAEYARELAAHVGSQHSEIVIGQKEFLDFLPEMVRYSDEPIADLASIPLYYVSKLARERVKVVLSGEGSDEIFAGYDIERLAAELDGVERKYSHTPRQILKAASKILPPGVAGGAKIIGEHGFPGYLRALGVHITRFWSEEEKRGLWRDAPPSDSTDDLIRSWYFAAKSEHPIDQLQQVYSGSWLVEDLLMKADKMTMANSLELRVPFLDHRLVEWAFRLPLEWKVGNREKGWVSKRIVREFARKRLPASIIDRPKRGFPVPAYEWLKTDIAGWARERLMEKGNFISSVFDAGGVEKALSASAAGDPVAAHKVWILLILEFWGECWVK